MSRLLDDQPVDDTGEDRLRLTRYLDIIDKRVLQKDDSLLREGKSPPPFVVGVFGRWGTGGSKPASSRCWPNGSKRKASRLRPNGERDRDDPPSQMS